MIAPLSVRSAVRPAPRDPAPVSNPPAAVDTGQPPPSAGNGATGAQGGDGDLIETDAALDAKIAAIAAEAANAAEEEVERRRAAFDTAATIEAEGEREYNALRDMAMAALKTDDELLKKWIELI